MCAYHCPLVCSSALSPANAAVDTCCSEVSSFFFFLSCRTSDRHGEEHSYYSLQCLHYFCSQLTESDASNMLFNSEYCFYGRLITHTGPEGLN